MAAKERVSGVPGRSSDDDIARRKLVAAQRLDIALLGMLTDVLAVGVNRILVIVSRENYLEPGVYEAEIKTSCSTKQADNRQKLQQRVSFMKFLT